MGMGSITSNIAQNALCEAAKNGDVDLCQDLIARGADVNGFGYNGNFTALHHAAEDGREEVCKLLLGHGANVHLVTGHTGETALARAALGNPMCAAVIRLLLEHKADPKMKRILDGSTPLHQVALHNLSEAPEAITLLADYGANVHATNQWNYTPLHQVALHGAPLENARTLMRIGADPAYVPEQFEPDYQTPLEMAAKYGRRELLDFFLTEKSEILGQICREGKSLRELIEQDATSLATLLSVMSERAVRNALPEQAAGTGLKRSAQGVSPL